MSKKVIHILMIKPENQELARSYFNTFTNSVNLPV